MIDIDEKQVGTDDSGRLIIEWDLDAAERSGETAKRVPLGIIVWCALAPEELGPDNRSCAATSRIMPVRRIKKGGSVATQRGMCEVLDNPKRRKAFRDQCTELGPRKARSSRRSNELPLLQPKQAAPVYLSP